MSDSSTASDPAKKRKRVPKPPPQSQTAAEPKPEPKPRRRPESRSESPTESRAWICLDHPVLYGGRPGAVVVARTEDEARLRLIDRLNDRGVKATHELHFEALRDGDVFMFQ